MNYFTSDWHLNEKRIFEFNPFFRPFKSINEQNETIINNCNNIVKEDDTLYFVGDVAMDKDGLELITQIKCKNKILIKGNYDNLDIDYYKYFNKIYNSLFITINDIDLYLNHYPINHNPNYFNIVGHIHGLWKVQRNMINVSCDAWHFKPVSENEILFTINAIQNHYDSNVFPY